MDHALTTTAFTADGYLNSVTEVLCYGTAVIVERSA